MLLVVVGFCVYWFYGRTKPAIESAMLHVIRRIAAKELVTGALNAELKEIIRERDGIVRDHFDEIMENGAVLDLERSVSREEFFAAAAAALAPRTGMERVALVDALEARERESSTVVAPGLAVPHVIVDGEDIFDILLVRAREGIRLAEGTPPVRIAFVLVGTIDHRDLHLRALSAIAQVVQSPGFESRWMEAKDEQELRDTVLLAERRRPHQP